MSARSIELANKLKPKQDKDKIEEEPVDTKGNNVDVIVEFKKYFAWLGSSMGRLEKSAKAREVYAEAKKYNDLILDLEDSIKKVKDDDSLSFLKRSAKMRKLHAERIDMADAYMKRKNGRKSRKDENNRKDRKGK